MERFDAGANRIPGRHDFRHPERHALAADDVRLLRGAQLGERVGRFARLQVEHSQRGPHGVDVFFGAEEENGRCDEDDPSHRAADHTR